MFELVCNGDTLPFSVARRAGGYGAKVDQWATDAEREFYADMLPKLKPGCVILQINGVDVLFSEFEHVLDLLDPSEREDGSLPDRPLVLLLREGTSKWTIVKQNLTFIATVLKERWGVGQSEEDAEQYELLCKDFLRCAKMGRADQMLTYLVESNPPPDVDYANAVGATALHIGVAKKDTRVVRLLLKCDADVFAADDNGLTPLHVAVAQGSFEMAEMILAKRCARTGGLLHQTEADGRTVVHLAAISGNVEVLRTLLRMGNSKSALSGGGSVKHGGGGTRAGQRLDLFLRDTQWGWEPLHYAAHYGHAAFVEELLRRGANVHSRTGVKRATVLGLAERGDHHACAEVIRAALATSHMHRVLETGRERWLGREPHGEVWVGDRESTRRRHCWAADITVVISLTSERCRREEANARWIYDDAADGDGDGRNEAADDDSDGGEEDFYMDEDSAEARAQKALAKRAEVRRRKKLGLPEVWDSEDEEWTSDDSDEDALSEHEEDAWLQTEVGEYDAFGMKRGVCRRRGVTWLQYWSDDYARDFWIDTRDATGETVVWDEPVGIDEDPLGDKKARKAARVQARRRQREVGFGYVRPLTNAEAAAQAEKRAKREAKEAKRENGGGGDAEAYDSDEDIYNALTVAQKEERSKNQMERLLAEQAAWANSKHRNKPRHVRYRGVKEYHFVRCEDGESPSDWASVLRVLPKVSVLLSRACHRGERVLVQCRSGQRASVAAILGMLLTKRGIPDDPSRGLPFLRLEESLKLITSRLPVEWAPGRAFVRGLEQLQEGLDKKRTDAAWRRMDRLYKVM